MSKKATEFQKKEMSKMYRGKEIFKPLNTGRIDENVACVREWVANIFFYRKGDTTIMIDAGYNLSLIHILIVGLAALVIAEVFPLPIAMLFGAANESAYYADFTVKCFRIYLCLMPLATLNKGTFIYLQALGKALASTAVSLTREIIFGVFLPILLPIFLGLDGLLWSLSLIHI